MPSAATAMDVGLRIWGARAASSIDQPGAGCGKGSPLRLPGLTSSDHQGHDESENRHKAGTHEFPSLGDRKPGWTGQAVASRSEYLHVSWGDAFYRPFPFVSIGRPTDGTSPAVPACRGCERFCSIRSCHRVLVVRSRTPRAEGDRGVSCRPRTIPSGIRPIRNAPISVNARSSRRRSAPGNRRSAVWLAS